MKGGAEEGQEQPTHRAAPVDCPTAPRSQAASRGAGERPLLPAPGCY